MNKTGRRRKMFIARGVTERCRLSWLTKSALAYEPKCGGRRGCGVSTSEYSGALHMEPK